MPVSELEKRIGYLLTSYKLREGIFSIIFIEDWYFDEKSLNIYKKVKIWISITIIVPKEKIK